MIHPDEIRRKAENLYRDCLKAWLDGDETFFPRVIPARKLPDAHDLAGAIESIRRLRDSSREVLGYGYTVEWREVNSRRLGRNRLPARILFATRDDYLRFIGKQEEFLAFARAVTELRAEFPVLEGWVRSNVQATTEAAADLDGLLSVLRYFRDRPRPNLFVRELPLGVDTKFIERHRGLLRQWLDAVLPAHAIRADEDHFERRYGLRYAEPHLHVRLLDPQLERELGFPCSEFSLPLQTLAGLPVRAATVYVVENKVNLLTLPFLERGLGLGGLGQGVTLLRHIPWLQDAPIVYWGDLDVEGLGILASLRMIYPQTRSFLMGRAALDRWRHLATAGTGRGPEVPACLTEEEQAAWVRCRDENLRLEQERIPQPEVLEALGRLVAEQSRAPSDGGPATSSHPRTGR